MFSKEIQDAICTAIEVIVDKKLQQLDFNYTVKAKVLAAPASPGGRYYIEYQGERFRAYAIDKDHTYHENDTVYVLWTNNGNSNFDKIILAKIPK